LSHNIQVGNHIDVQKGIWTATDAGIGAGVDSYFEYLVKGASLFSDEKLLNMFHGEFWTPLYVTSDKKSI